MATGISERAQRLTDETEGMDEESAEEIQTYADSVSDTVAEFGDLQNNYVSQFAVLWMTLELDYGPHLNRSRALQGSLGTTLYGSSEGRFNSLVESVQLFAIGNT